jgi:nitroimidazol reductase NimA-like FMN-containing flavoprotein (pyridoxamine 5'-phosphate oxidase superfamily)
MTTPVTALDARFSAPDATATSWDETRQVLESAELSWLTTVRADGRPHVTPLVAVWLDDALHFCTGAGEQKLLNLAANPSVVVTVGGRQWDAGLDVVVEGRAVRVTDPGTLARLAQAWTAKWDGRWQYQVREGGFGHPEGGDFAVHVFAVAPVKVLAFRQGSFSQTSHRF